MNNLKTLGFLLLNMITVSLVVAGIGIYQLYRITFRQQEQKLLATTKTQARLIEAIYQTTQNTEITLKSVAKSSQNLLELENIEDIVIAKRDKEQIILLLQHGNYDPEKLQTIPWSQQPDPPIKLALMGYSGTITSLDHRGQKVLYAYEPIRTLNWGLVKKISMSELEGLFIRRGFSILLGALLVNGVGAILFLRIGNPLVQELAASRELEREHQLIKNIFDTTSSLIIVLDPQGKIIGFNRASEEITNYTFAEVKNQNFDNVLLDNEQLDINLIDKIKSEQLSQKHENTWLTKDKTKRTIVWSYTLSYNPSGTLDYIIITGSDITERKVAEQEIIQLNQKLEQRVKERTQELEYSNQKLQQEISERQRLEEALRREIDLLARVMETSPVGILVVNHQGKMILASRRAEEILRLTTEELLQVDYSNPPWKITDYQGNILAHDELPFQQIIKMGRAVYDLRYAIELQDKSRVFLSMSGSPLFNEQHQLEGIILSFEDITEKLAVEAALLHSEAQFRAIFEQAAVGICILSLSGNFIRVNQRYCDLLGYTEREIKAKKYQKITDTNNSKMMCFFEKNTLENKEKSYSFEEQYKTKKGDLKWVSTTISGVRNHRGELEYLIGVVTDISERKQAEDALQNSEQRLRSIFNQAAVGIFQYSLDGKFILFNDKFVNLLQYSAAELKEKTLQQITYKEDQNELDRYIEKMLKGSGDNLAIELRYCRKNEEPFWVNLSLSLVKNTQKNHFYLIGVVEDISERKKALEALREREEQYRSIVETTDEGVWIIDTDYKIVFVNSRMAEMLGYSVSEILGKSIFDFTGEAGKFIWNKDRKINREPKREHYDLKFVRKDGSALWVMITTNALFDAAGQYTGILGMITDITSRKYAEESLKKLNEKLSRQIQELEERNRDILLLNHINDFLQACLRVEEAYEVIGELIEPLFPKCSGGIFMINSSNTFVEMVATWGKKSSSKNLFTVDECWALRRGYLHWANSTHASLFCRHIRENELPTETLCVPMMAQGKALGLLYLTTPEPGMITDVTQQLARAVSEHLSLALTNLKLRETLQTQSIQDPLTGLYNRRYMEESLKREINLATRKHTSLGFIMLDVDHFKQFNDNFGHRAGDLVLQEIGNFLLSNVRSGDIACRYGGEEFLLIFPEASLENTRQRAEEIRLGIKTINLQQYEQSFNGVTVSLGVACFPEHGKTAETVIQCADSALYQAKKQGRDQVVVFSFDDHTVSR